MRNLRGSLSMLLTLGMICLPIYAATPVAIVTPLSGLVLLNGHSIMGGEAIKTGDRVQTNANSVVRLLFPGSAVYANAGSEFEVVKNALHLHKGQLDVNGSTKVLAASEIIAAAEPNGNFSVIRSNGMLLVRSNRGAVAVSGAMNYMVPAGSTVRMQTTPAATATGGSSGCKNKVITAALVSGIATGVVTGIVVHNNSGACKDTSQQTCIVSPNK